MINYVFFLGGYDAEMLEIREILLSMDIQFFDKQLSWGAKLSDYNSEIDALPPTFTPVFIELIPDYPIPKHAIEIDHHNEKAGSDKKTSIEQVADLLKITLDRKQKLISANDKGHIRAMKRLCATDEEIHQIRTLDRKAQGVTHKDESLAEKSIMENMEKISADAVLVQSLTPHASTIFDRLYEKYSHIFVFLPDGEMAYTGKGYVVKNLKNIFSAISQNEPTLKFWYGGDLPEYGFFGANRRPERIIDRSCLKEVVMEKIQSQHILMFPFTISEKNTCDSLDLSFMNRIKNALEHAGWKPNFFDPAESREKYNEYNYFHGAVKDALFYRKESNGDSLNNKTPPLMMNFKKDPGENATYKIGIKCKDDPYELKLDIKNINLLIFETSIGILSIELANTRYSDMNDILAINDRGRRIYPQFIGVTGGMDVTKKAFLPDYIHVQCAGVDKLEDFDECRFRKSHPVVANFISAILGETCFTSDPSPSEDKIPFLFKPTIDDRMYLVCWHGSDRWSRVLKARNHDGMYNYENSESWYQFVFQDHSCCTCQHPEMLKRLIRESTYQRWVDWGTFYGASRYSFVCISALNDDFSYDIIREHMRTNYARMCLILLAQRTSILKFSEEVALISGRITERLNPENKKNVNRQEIKDIALEVERLHAAYIRFVNRLWFTEVTPQEQGIELYDMAIEQMRINDQIHDLRNEIKELYEYVRTVHDRKEAQQMKNLTVLGAIFLPLMFISGVLGMNTLFIEDGVYKHLEALRRVSHSPQLLLHSHSIAWTLSLISLLLFIWLVFATTRRLIKELDNNDSDILKYLSLCYWLKLFMPNKKSDKKQNQKRS